MSAVRELGIGLAKDARDDLVTKFFGEIKDLLPRTSKRGIKAFKPVTNALRKAARALRKDFSRQQDLTRHPKRKLAFPFLSSTVRVPEGGTSAKRSKSGKRHSQNDIAKWVASGSKLPKALQPQKSNMPHGSRSRMSNRGTVKSRSRNIRSNLTISRPLSIKAKRSQYAEVKYGTEAEDLVNDSMIQMSKPVQGPEGDDRIGDEIRALEMSVQLQVFKATGSLVADIDQWRFTLFQWTPNSSVAPVPADIFEDVPSGTVARQFFNLQRRPLYKVLYDVSGSLTGLLSAPVLGNACTGIQKVTVKIPKQTITYDKTAVTGANNVFGLFQSWGVTANPTATMSFRFTFTDS